VQDQVLRRIVVGELERRLHRICRHCQTLADGAGPGQVARLEVDLVLDLFEELGEKVNSDEHDLQVDTVRRSTATKTGLAVLSATTWEKWVRTNK
jgi:hypothetical protein